MTGSFCHGMLKFCQRAGRCNIDAAGSTTDDEDYNKSNDNNSISIAPIRMSTPRFTISTQNVYMKPQK